MGFLQQAGKSISSSKSSGGFLQQAGVSNLAESAKQIPVMQKTGAVSPTTVKKTSSFIQPTKETGPITSTKYKIGNVDFGRLGKSIKSGTELVPSQLKTAGGIILSSVARQAEKANEFFGKVETAQNIIRPRFIEEATAQVRARKKLGHQMLELKGTQLREAGTKEAEKKQKEISKRMTPSKGLQSYLEMASFNLPQMATTTALTIATGIVTRNPALAATVGLSTSYGLGASEVYSEARRNGLKDAEAMPLAQAGGALIGAIDFLPLGRLLTETGAIKPIQKSITKKIAQGVVSLGVQSGFEGITEGLQEVIGNAIKSTYKENQNLFEGVKESVVVGALLGGITDVTVAGVTGSIENKATPEQVVDHVNKQVEKALNTPPEKRTQEQEAVVRTMSERVVSPDEAITMVIDMGIEKSEVGKKLVLASLEAKQANKDVRVTQNRSAREINIEVVSADQSTPPLSPTAETPDRGVVEQGSTKPPAITEEDQSLLQSQEAVQVEQADTPEAKKAREELETKQRDIEQAKQENQAKRSILEQFNSTQIRAMRAIKRSIQKLESEGLDPTNVSKIESYQRHIEDIMTAIGTKSEDDALAYIREDLPDAVTTATTRKELQEIRVLKSRIQPKEVPVQRSQLPVGQGKPKVSKLEARIKGVVDKITESTKEQIIEEFGLSTYNTMNRKETIAKASEYVSENREDAMRVLKGTIQPPQGIPPEAIYVAMLQEAKGDMTLATKLASLQATSIGQRLSLLAEIDPDSPVRIMNEIYRVREEAFKKKYKDQKPAQVRNNVERQIRESVSKPDKYDWNTFISSLEC